jgi:hypothetical protein
MGTLSGRLIALSNDKHRPRTIGHQAQS